MSVFVEVSIGELLDKLSILQIKQERISDPEKLKNINREADTLSLAWERSALPKEKISEEISALREANEKLWDLEDKIREKEAALCFDEEFIETARNVYINNDKRADIKKRINNKLGSQLIEEKSYADYAEEQKLD